MPTDEDEPPPVDPEARARLFDLPARPAPPPVRSPVPDAPLELEGEQRAHAQAVVIERIRVGGPAVLVRLLLISGAIGVLLYQALRLVYRH